MALLELDSVDAGYGENQVLHNLTMDVEADRVNCIIGPNGSGKSTALKTVAGLLDVWDGSITLRGADITDASPRDVVTAGVAMLPQGGRVFTDMSVKDNLRAGAYLVDDSDELARRYGDIFDTFPDLEDRQSARAGDLSGGQQMMVAMGRSLMANPDLLLLDEPSAGLAPHLVEEMFEHVAVLKDAGMDMLIIEQNVRMVLDITDYVYVFDQGQVAFEGDTAELKSDEQIIEMYLGSRDL